MSLLLYMFMFLKKNFFEAISHSDMERLHSAVIGWMLSNDCVAFDNKTKTWMLHQIFNINYNNEVYSSIKYNLEIDDIDILIETENHDASGKIICKYWVVENKLKSTLHDNQLLKYFNIIESKYQSAENRYYCLLSLINEKTSNLNWRVATYKNVADCLEKALYNVSFFNTDLVILSEYLKCLKHLNESFDIFLSNPKDYQNVFTDGNKKKSNKDISKLNDIGTYIALNGMETIFQKAYLNLILSKMFSSSTPIETWVINETRGTALADYLSSWVNDNLMTHIQIQGGSFKVSLHEVFEKTESKLFIKQWESVFDDLVNENQGWTKNLGHTHPYISISMSDNDNGKWYTKQTNEIVAHWTKKYKISVKIQNDLKKKVGGGWTKPKPY